MVNQAGQKKGHQGLYIWNISYTSHTINSFWNLLWMCYKLRIAETTGHCSGGINNSALTSLAVLLLGYYLHYFTAFFLSFNSPDDVYRTCLWSYVNCRLWRPTFHLSSGEVLLPRLQRKKKTCWQLLQAYMIVFLGGEAYIQYRGPIVLSVRLFLEQIYLFIYLFFILSGPFSRQWSEKLPLSFSAASLTSSPVCLRAICYASPLFIHQTLPTDTVPTNGLTPQVVQSSRPHPRVSNRDRLLNSNSCIACMTDP